MKIFSLYMIDSDKFNHLYIFLLQNTHNTNAIFIIL